MSNNGSVTPLRDVDKTIEEALKGWEKFGFKDMDLWETFQYDFEGFTEEDFRSASIHHQREFRAYLRKYGVLWILGAGVGIIHDFFRMNFGRNELMQARTLTSTSQESR